MSGPTRNLAKLDFVGGNLGLDFANTINSRTAPEHDYLATWADLVAWTERAAALHPDVLLPRARSAGGPDRPAGPRALAQAHRLRDAVYRTFSAIASGGVAPAGEARRVLGAYGTAVTHGSLADDRPGGLRWAAPTRAADVLDPIAFSAGSLLLARDRPPVKECPGCGWLFLDQSRNGSRRWCDMQTCGSRDKMRRYHRSRHRAVSA